MLKTLVIDILECGIHLATTHGEDRADEFNCPKSASGRFRISTIYPTKEQIPHIFIYRESQPRFKLTPNDLIGVDDFVKTSPDPIYEMSILAHEFGHWGSWMSQSTQQTTYQKVLRKQFKHRTYEDWYQEAIEEFRAWQNALDYLSYREAEPEVLTYVQAQAFKCLRSRFIKL